MAQFYFDPITETFGSAERLILIDSETDRVETLQMLRGNLAAYSDMYQKERKAEEAKRASDPSSF